VATDGPALPAELSIKVFRATVFLLTPELASHIAELLGDNTGLCIGLELTERRLYARPEQSYRESPAHCMTAAIRCRLMNCKQLISSLSYLRRFFPASTLKIDILLRQRHP